MTVLLCFFFQAEDGIRDADVTGVQTCALPISRRGHRLSSSPSACAHTGSPISPTPTARARSQSSLSREAISTRTTRGSGPRTRPASTTSPADLARRKAPEAGVVGHERHHVSGGCRDAGWGFRTVSLRSPDYEVAKDSGGSDGRVCSGSETFPQPPRQYNGCCRRDRPRRKGSLTCTTMTLTAVGTGAGGGRGCAAPACWPPRWPAWPW